MKFKMSFLDDDMYASVRRVNLVKKESATNSVKMLILTLISNNNFNMVTKLPDCV